METNKLIMNFMGWDFEEAYTGGNSSRFDKWLCPHNVQWIKSDWALFSKSFDWLKPAIDKFLSIPIETFNYNAKAMSEFRSVRTSLANMPISKSIADFYNELISAIIWYNENKPV